jgi:hypothetical protein
MSADLAPKRIREDFIDRNAWPIKGGFPEKRMSIAED